MNTQSIQQTMTDEQLAAWQEHLEYMAGFNAYADGAIFDATESVGWRRGWREARIGEAYCDRLDAHVEYVAESRREMGVHVLTDEEMRAELSDYESDMLDREDWMRGAW